MTTKSPILLLLLALTPLSALADDSGMGVEVEASRKITKPLELSIEAEVRTQEGVSELERWSLGASLDYKLTKYLKADLGYVLIDRYKPSETNRKGTKCSSDYWSPRHRAFCSLSLDWKLSKHWSLSLRERYQYTYETRQLIERHRISDGHRLSDKVTGEESENLLRSRLQLKWSRKRCAWQPFVHIEALNDLGDAFSLDQMRYTAGTDYKINKHQSLGLSYRYKDKSSSDDSQGHLISFSYGYAF